MDELAGKKVSVIGAARSGIAAAEALVQRGAKVLLSDSKSAEAIGMDRVAEVGATGASSLFEASAAEALPEGTELVVTSPGVPRYAPVLEEAVRRGIPVWGEIELAYRLNEGSTAKPIIATTGTNGKTTTTLLIAAMLEMAGLNPIICGNVSADEIKRTMVEAVVSPSRQSRSVSGKRDGGVGHLVAEISSFQLEWVERFRPDVGILTNITPDHLNRHRSFEEYVGAKANLFRAQNASDWAIINYDNPASRQVGESGVPGRRCWFTRQGTPPDGGPCAWPVNGVLTVRLTDGHSPVALLDLDELPETLPGGHSIENVLAASAAALALGADPDAIAEAILGFRGVPHRMEFVAEIGGVRYINNSMCTNLAAAVSSLQAMNRPSIVIAGGADKELDFSPLTPTLKEKARQLILIGSVADKMERTFRAGGYDAITRAATLQEAVQIASRFAQPGEAVLLSPACASFDMFTDFEARGAAFRSAVYTLQEA